MLHVMILCSTLLAFLGAMFHTMVCFIVSQNAQYSIRMDGTEGTLDSIAREYVNKNVKVKE